MIDEGLEPVTVAPHPGDSMGDELHAVRQERIGLWKGATYGSLALVLVFALTTVILALRKPITRWVKTDEIRGAQSIAYNDLNPPDLRAPFTRRLVKIELEKWAVYRFQDQRATMATEHRKHYFFLVRKYAEAEMQQDLKERLVANVVAGRVPENTVQVNGTEIAMPEGRRPGMARIDLYKNFAQASVNVPARREHWVVTLSFVVDPAMVDVLAEQNPEYETWNSLGVFIVNYEMTKWSN